MVRRAVLRSLAVTVLVVGFALVAAIVAPAASGATPCRESAAVGPAPAPLPVVAATQGVDLELRVLNLRIEFPWLKDLPITPGRRIVISWMERGARRE
jgi:hypothetical protein